MENLAVISSLPKCRTGISGVDEILDGGLPAGRTSLVVGAAGCGKTVMAMEFLARGALEFDEPGVFVAFEERRKDLVENFASLGFDLAELEKAGKLRIDHVDVDPLLIAEAGEYDLEGLFIRLKSAIDAVGAKRVVLDTLEVLFAGLTNYGILRSELRRLFEWLKEIGVTAIATAERGTTTMTRHGLEEYVADCVIFLENAVEEGNATRRMRVVKYRGSAHGSNVYPFLIDSDGLSVLPITSMKLNYDVSTERVSTGVPRLDALLGGGIFRGSSVLLSGTAGCGKTSLASTFADAACRRGEKALYLAFEESPAQIVRNMKSIGLHLGESVDSGLLQIVSNRPSAYGLEQHLTEIHRLVSRLDPKVVILDPVSNFMSAGTSRDQSALLARLIDLMKARGITAVFTALTHASTGLEETQAQISSMMDTWLLLRDVETNGERNRALHVLKSRGSDHSNQVREIRITSEGVKLLDVYTGMSGMALGSDRLAHEARDERERVAREREMDKRQRDRQRRRAVLEAKIQALRAEFEATEEEEGIQEAEEEATGKVMDETRARVGRLRRADQAPDNGRAMKRATAPEQR